MLSIPTLVRGIMLAGYNEYPNLLKISRVLIPFYSIWNLDFFRTVIPDICLNVTTLQALALDYLASGTLSLFVDTFLAHDHKVVIMIVMSIA